MAYIIPEAGPTSKLRPSELALVSGKFPAGSIKTSSAPSSTGYVADFSGFKGSYGDGGMGGGVSIAAPSPSSGPLPNVVGMPMSSRTNITPSASINPYLGRPGWMEDYKRRAGILDESKTGQQHSGDDYTLSDAELWNTQLENAYLMKQLGYDVDFQDGEMVYNRRIEPDYLTSYGEYGYGDKTQAVYETDWLRANQAAVQPTQERYTYPPSGQEYYQQSGYRRPYPRNGYRSRYYSGYSQRYNGYGGYYGNRYGGNYRNGYRRYNGYNDYNGYNRYRNNNSYYNRNRWYGSER